MHKLSGMARTNVVPFIAGVLVVVLLGVTGFFHHLFAAEATDISASPSGISNVAAFEGVAWSSLVNAIESDGEVATSTALGDGFYRITEGTPSIPTGVSAAVDFHPNHTYLAVGHDGDGAGLSIVDVKTLEIVSGTFQQDGYVNTLKFSDDGNWLAIGLDNDGADADELIILNTSSSNPASWSPVIAVEQPPTEVEVVAFSPDDGYLAIGLAYYGDGEERLMVYDTDTWTILDDGEVEPAPLTFGIGSNDILNIAFDPTSTYLSVAHEWGNGFTVISTDTWEVEAGNIGTPGEPSYEGTDLDGVGGAAISFSPDSDYLLVGMLGASQEIYILDASDLDPANWSVVASTSPNAGDASGVWDFEFSPDGDTLAVAYQNSGHFGVVDTSSEDPTEWVGIDTSEGVGELGGGKGGASGQGVSYSPDGQYIAVAQSGGTGLALITTQNPSDTRYLVADGFNMAIPEDATILGIEVEVEKMTASTSVDRVMDNSVRLVVGGTPTGDNMAVDDEWWSNDPDGEVVVYGDSDDTWGVALTPEIVNAGGFGVALSAAVTLGAAGVDAVVLTVHYIAADEEEEPVRRTSSSGGKPRVTTPAPATTPTAPAAPGTSELMTQLRALIAQYVALGGTVTPELQAFMSTGSGSGSTDIRDLEYDMEGEDVRMLQTLLMAQGYSIPPGATAYFGTYTEDALIAYQQAHGITPAVGYFGATTRAQMKSAGLGGLWW